MFKMFVLAITAVFFSGCTHKVEYIQPKLFTIYTKNKPLPSRKINFKLIEADTVATAYVKSVLIPFRDAKWITAKLNRCTKNAKKLEIANKALNEQIEKNNDK